jgi:uncharacterized membrane protein
MADESSEKPAAAKKESAPDVPHRRLVTALLIIATVIGFFSIFGLWVNRQALNTDDWTGTSTKLLENKKIQTALSTYLVDELYANVDVQAQLAQRLPPQLQSLAGPAASGLHSLANQVALKTLQAPKTQEFWRNANRAAHIQLLRVVNGGSGALSTSGGNVTLDLNALVAQISSGLGVGSKLADKLPASVGQLTILKSNQLGTAQDVAHGIKGLVVFLVALVLILYGVAVYLARDRRRKTLRAVGIGFVVAGIAALIARNLAGHEVVNALAQNATIKPASNAVWAIGTSVLKESAISVIVNGLIIIIAAWLAGPTRPAVAFRREAAPYMRERPVLTYAASATLFLVLVIWAPSRAFTQPATLIIIAVLLIFATEVLRRQTAREFPQASLGGPERA